MVCVFHFTDTREGGQGGGALCLKMMRRFQPLLPPASALKLAACPEQSGWYLQSLWTVAASDKVNKPHTGTFFSSLSPASKVYLVWLTFVAAGG